MPTLFPVVEVLTSLCEMQPYRVVWSQLIQFDYK